MMSPRFLLMVVAVAALVVMSCMVALALSSSRYQRSADHLAQLRVTVDRLETLRHQHPVATGSAADGELLARIQRALGQVGLPASTCTGIMPRGDELQPGGSRQRVVSVTLGGLSVADLGGWLTAFRSDGNAWRVAELQCVAGGLDRNRYAVSVLLASALPESAP